MAINDAGGIGGINSAQGLNNIDTGNANISIADATMLVMLERSEILEGQIRDQIQNVHDKNQKLQKLSDIQAKLRNMQSNTNTVDSASWTVDRETMPKTIALDNGYSITIPGKKEEWTITDANGNHTRIWGDPHVSEGDSDGSKNWDFQEDASFVLDDGTKISVGVKDIGHGEGYVVTDTLTITKGNQSLEVTNIAANDPQIGQPSLDGAEMDASTNDGHVFMMGDQVDDWTYQQGGGREIGADGWENVTSDVGAIEHEQSAGVNDQSNINNVLTQDEIALLDELGINIFDNSNLGALTPTELQNLNESIKSSKDSLTSMSQLEMVKLQSYNSKYEQTNAMASQVMKSQYSQAKEIIRNI